MAPKYVFEGVYVRNIMAHIDKNIKGSEEWPLASLNFPFIPMTDKMST